MRNLKRALSLVLAVVMVIGLMVVGASAVSYNDFSDRGEIVNKDAVSMLTTLGIIEGQPDGSYNPTGNVDRAQMAKMISVALTNNEDCDTLYQNVNSGLTDISANWARGYINYCYVRGIIAGRGDNTFDPSANVTGVEAAKMLLAALGYNAEIEGLVGPDWALNTAALAQQLGIFRNFTKDVSEPLNRDDAALLIYNALDVEMIQQYSNGYALVYGDHRTILSSVFGVIRVEGVVVGNEWAQLQNTNSDAAMREGKTTLDEVVWYDSTTANTRVEEGVEVTGYVTFNVSTPVEYMGKAVTMYVEKTTILSNSKVVGVATDDDMNIVQTNVSTEDTSKDYLKGTGVAIDSDTDFYVNYGVVASEDAAIELINEHTKYAGRNAKFDLNGIEVQVIDNDDDGLAEYVLYLVETLSEVSRYSERNEELSFYTPYDKDGKLVTAKSSGNPATVTREFGDVVYAETVSLGGVETVESLDLAAEDLILYVEYGGRTYVKLPEIVTGVMSRVDRDKDNELYITVNDTEYRQSFIMDAASLVDVDVTRFDIENAKSEPGFDTEYDFILDSNGYVIAIRPAEEVVTNYALVIESAWTQNSLTKAGEIKVLMADGTENTYDINWNESRKAFDYDGDRTNKELDAALENYLGTRDVEHDGNYATGAAIGTVITYSLNEDGDELTIEDIMNQNQLDETGYTLDDKTSGESVPQVDVDSYDVVYIADNVNALKYQSTQYKVGTADSTGKYNADDYKTGDGTLYLTTVENGDSTAKGEGEEISYAIDKDTVAFYFVGTGDGEYGVATGWENMSDVAAGTDAQVYPVLEKDNRGGWEATRLADVVMFNSMPTNDSNDYMLVLDANHLAKDELWLNVVFEDGTAAEIEIDSDGGHDFDEETSYMKAYAYSENADGTYDISSKAPISAYDGVLIRRDTVDWDGATDYLTIVGSTHVWDVTDVSRADEEVTAGSFTYNDKNAVVVRGGSRQENIRTAWVWDKDAESEEGYVSGLYNPRVESVKGNNITIRKYVQDVLGSKELTELLADELDAVDVKKVTPLNAAVTEIMITDTDGDFSFWNIQYTELRRVTYNNKDYFLAQGEEIKVESANIMYKTEDDADFKSSSNEDVVDGENVWRQKTAVTGDNAKDVILRDAWNVTNDRSIDFDGGMTWRDGTSAPANGATSRLLAGDAIVMNNGTVDTIVFQFKDKDGKVIESIVAKAGETVTAEMPAQNITIDWIKQPVEITLNYVNNLSGADGEYMWSAWPKTAMSNETIEVKVAVKANPDTNKTLGLTGTNGATVTVEGSALVEDDTRLGTEYTFKVDLSNMTGTSETLTLGAS